MADSAALQSHLASIIKGIKDGHHDVVLRSSEQYLASAPDQEVLFCKVMALVHQNKLTQALQVVNSIKAHEEKSKFLKAYICYRLADYKEALSLAESTMNDTKMTVLKSQIQCKRENYEVSCNILAGLILENKDDIRGIYEDLVANFFNSLALFTWTTVNNKKQIQLNASLKSGLAQCLKYCSTEFSKITLREVYLNLCILLAIDTTFGAGIFSSAEFKAYSREFLTKFEAILKTDSENHMDVEPEEGRLSEREKDRLISKVIEVIFDRKNNRIKVIEEDISRLEKDYFKLGEEDIFLKTSVLSYLIYMKMNTGSTAEMHVMTKEIDGIVAVLKKSRLTKKLQEIVQTNLLFNRSITLLLRGKFQDVKDLELSNDVWDNLSMKAYVSTKNKKVDSVLELASEAGPAQGADRFLLSLLQIASFHLLNNQALYVEKFAEFMNVAPLSPRAPSCPSSRRPASSSRACTASSSTAWSGTSSRTPRSSRRCPPRSRTSWPASKTPTRCTTSPRTSRARRTSPPRSRSTAASCRSTPATTKPSARASTSWPCATPPKSSTKTCRASTSSPRTSGCGRSRSTSCSTKTR